MDEKFHSSTFNLLLFWFAAPPKGSSSHWHTSWQESIQTCSESSWSGSSIWCTFGNVSQGPCLFLFLSHVVFLISCVWCHYFNQDKNRRQDEREWMGEKYLLHFFDYDIGHKKYIIWGLTAGILIRAASVVYQRQPAFVEQNPKFKLPQDVSKDTIIPWVQYLLYFFLDTCSCSSLCKKTCNNQSSRIHRKCLYLLKKEEGTIPSLGIHIPTYWMPSQSLESCRHWITQKSVNKS